MNIHNRVEGLKKQVKLMVSLFRNDFDEVLAIKLHYFSSIISLCLEHMKKKDTVQLDSLVKQ